MAIREGIEIPDHVAVEYDKLMEKANGVDRLQYVYKIKLNSAYGALTNYYFRFFRLEAGESTTGTGRAILRHQIRRVGEVLDGVYNFTPPVDVEMLERDKESGDYRIVNKDVDYRDVKFPSPSIIYGDTDSVHGDSEISLLILDGDRDGTFIKGQIATVFDTILSDLAYVVRNHESDNSTKRDMLWLNKNMVFTPTYVNGEIVYMPVKFLYKHGVNKQLFQLTTSDDSSVTVTEDHSIMVERDGDLLEVKPTDIIIGQDVAVMCKE